MPLSKTGQPASLEPALQKVLGAPAGAVSAPSAEEQKEHEHRRMQMELSGALQAVQEAINAKDFKRAVRLCEDLALVHPEYKASMLGLYGTAKAYTRPDEAYKDAVLIKNDASQPYILAGAFARSKGLEARFYQYAVEVFQGRPSDVGAWIPMASAYAALHNKEKAVECQQKVVDWINTGKAGTTVAFMG